MNSVKKNLNKNLRKFCFQLFGYDFILDSNFNVWLIEINTNPCLEESSPLLKMLIPRMINDLLKLTIDVVFPLLPNENQKKEIIIEEKDRRPDYCTHIKA